MFKDITYALIAIGILIAIPGAFVILLGILGQILIDKIFNVDLNIFGESKSMGGRPWLL